MQEIERLLPAKFVAEIVDRNLVFIIYVIHNLFN
jgi:hypothetical protein